MRLVFMGTPDFAVPSLQALYDNNHEVLAVFTQPDKPKGRGYKLTPPPVKVLANEHNTPVYQPASLKKGEDAVECVNLLNELSPDFIIVVAYGKILPKEVLDIPKFCCINVHGSILPKYRGAAPIQWSVLNGDEETGVTTMVMAEGLDTGDILQISTTKIGENETSAMLFDRLSTLGSELLVQTLNEFTNIKARKQDETLATYASMLSKEQCAIDFTRTAQEVHNQIRGLSDWPCATCQLDGKRLKVYQSRIVEFDKKIGCEGEVVGEKDLVVACGTGAVEFVEIQAEGSKRMLSKDFLRGKPIEKGTILS